MALNFQALSGQPFGYRAAVAAGSGQSTATALANYSGIIYNVTSANGTKGVKLPAASTGKYIIIKVDETCTSTGCPVYPATSGTINSGSANAAYTAAVGATVIFIGTSTTNWITLTGSSGASASGTLTTPLIKDGLTASGTAANDFSGSSGDFKTSTGNTTLTATTVSAGTPSLVTASGKTNTGYVQINGKTSGALKLTTADATAQTVTVAPAAQTVGASTLTIPDQAGVSSNFVFDTLAQTLSAKTLDGTNINQSYKILPASGAITYTSNVTPAVITGLSWTVAASGNYVLEAELDTTMTTVGGLTVEFVLTTATLTAINYHTYASTASDNTLAVSTSGTTTTSGTKIFDSKTSAYTRVRIWAVITVNAGGTFALHGCQNTSAGAGDVTIINSAFAKLTRAS